MINKFFIIFSNLIFIASRVVIPINYKLEKNYNKSDIKSIFDAYQNGQLEAQIKVGSNEIKIDFKLTFEYFSTTLANASIDEINIIYNINDSSTHEINETRVTLINEPIKYTYLSSDIFHLETKQKINFFLGIKSESDKDFKYQGVIGLGVNNVENYKYRSYNFINQLKSQKIIKDYALTFSKLNNKECLIIGDYPEIFDSNLYSSENRVNVFTSNLYYSQFKYYLLINNIITDNQIIETEKSIVFDLSSYFIEASFKYQNFMDEIFFEQYMNLPQPKCHRGIGRNLEYFYYCDKDVNISKVPNLIFQISPHDLNITLNEYNLFELIEDKLFFIAVFKNKSPLSWKIGYLGVKKMNMTFNQDEKTISFYKKLGRSKSGTGGGEGNKILLIVLISLATVFIILLVGFIIYYIKNKKKKKKANELDDDFIYESKDNDKLGINTN